LNLEGQRIELSGEGVNEVAIMTVAGGWTQ
jgi:hypothetical protein